MPKRVAHYAGVAEVAAPHGKVAEERRLGKLERALQVMGDSRYKEIVDFCQRPVDGDILQNARADSSRNGNPRYFPEKWNFPEPLGRRSAYVKGNPVVVSPQVQTAAAGEGSRQTEAKATRFAGRVAWEESLESHTKQLCLDFSLTSDPDCQLSHLERVHQWFRWESRKLACRSETPSPNFLTFSRNEPPPFGSARALPDPMNQATLHLAAATKMPKVQRARLERQFGVVPAPPPPKPSYK